MGLERHVNVKHTNIFVLKIMMNTVIESNDIIHLGIAKKVETFSDIPFQLPSCKCRKAKTQNSKSFTLKMQAKTSNRQIRINSFVNVCMYFQLYGSSPTVLELLQNSEIMIA